MKERFITPHDTVVVDSSPRYLREHPVEFADWILKHAYTHITTDGFFCYLYRDKEMSSAELYDEYKKHIYG